MIVARRMPNTTGVRLRDTAGSISRQRNSAGITRSLDTIVASATVATITMPVAAEKPPMKATSASVS